MPACDSERTRFAELRGLLLGPEQEEIRQLKERLENAQSLDKISRLLPEAVRLAAQRNRKLRSALQPVIEQSIRVSVRTSPSILGSALAPLIGEAVREAVASGLRALAESIQQTIEQSLTLRGARWRIEALQTGRPYAEIVLLRSVLYRVEHVFLIHRESGVMLAQASGESGGIPNGDLVSAMLTAIQDLVKDSFGGPAGNVVESIEAGEFVIWTQQSPQLVLAAFIRGAPPKALKAVFESVVDRICRSQADAIAHYDGDVSQFQSCQSDLAACFLGQGKTARRNISRTLTGVAAAFAVLIAACMYWPLREAWRWQQFMTALRSEPGVIVTESSRRAGKYFVSGLRDPLARNPVALLQRSGFSARDVNFVWQSFQSMEQPFAGLRDLAAAEKLVESRKIYFRSDSSQIPVEQLSNIEEAAEDVNELFTYATQAGKSVKIEVIGYTDSSGTEQHNAKLAVQRAEEVVASLKAAGARTQQLETKSASIREPVSGVDEDRRRAFNRSVSFRVRTVGA